MQQRMLEAMERRLVEVVNGDRPPGAARPVAAGRDEGPGAVAGPVDADGAGRDGLPEAARGGRPQALSTVYAPATAAGRAAVGMVRVSGPEAAAVCRALTGRPLPPPRRAVLRHLADPADGAPIDQAVLVWMPGPESFTGEDVLEIQHHGGTAVLALLLDALAAPARPAARRARRVRPPRVPERPPRPDGGRGPGRPDRRRHARPGPPGAAPARRRAGPPLRRLARAGAGLPRPGRGRDRFRRRGRRAGQHAGARPARGGSGPGRADRRTSPTTAAASACAPASPSPSSAPRTPASRASSTAWPAATSRS